MTEQNKFVRLLTRLVEDSENNKIANSEQLLDILIEELQNETFEQYSEHVTE